MQSLQYQGNKHCIEFKIHVYAIQCCPIASGFNSFRHFGQWWIFLFEVPPASEDFRRGLIKWQFLFCQWQFWWRFLQYRQQHPWFYKYWWSFWLNFWKLQLLEEHIWFRHFLIFLPFVLKGIHPTPIRTGMICVQIQGLGGPDLWDRIPSGGRKLVDLER